MDHQSKQNLAFMNIFSSFHSFEPSCGGMIDVVLLADLDEGIEIAEEMGHDGGERGIVTGCPYAGLAIGRGRDGDGDVFGHVSSSLEVPG